MTPLRPRLNFEQLLFSDTLRPSLNFGDPVEDDGEGDDNGDNNEDGNGAAGHDDDDDGDGAMGHDDDDDDRRRRQRRWRNDNDDDGDVNGATGDGIRRRCQGRWRRMTTTTTSMATARRAT